MQAEVFFKQCNDVISKNMLSSLQAFEKRPDIDTFDTEFVMDDFESGNAVSEEFVDDDLFGENIDVNVETEIEDTTFVSNEYFKSVCIDIVAQQEQPSSLRDYFFYFLNNDLHQCAKSVGIQDSWNSLFQTKVDSEEEALQMFVLMVFQLSIGLDAITLLSQNFSILEIQQMRGCTRTLHKNDLQELMKRKHFSWFSLQNYVQATVSTELDPDLFSLMESGRFNLEEIQNYIAIPNAITAYFTLKSSDKFEKDDFDYQIQAGIDLQQYVHKKVSSFSTILDLVSHRSDYQELHTIIEGFAEELRDSHKFELLCDYVQEHKDYCGLSYQLQAMQQGVPLSKSYEEYFLKTDSIFLKNAGEAYVTGINIDILQIAKSDYYLYTFNDLVLSAQILKKPIAWKDIPIDRANVCRLLEAYWKSVLTIQDLLKFAASALCGVLNNDHFTYVEDILSFNHFCYKIIFFKLGLYTESRFEFDFPVAIGSSITFINSFGQKRVLSAYDCVADTSLLYDKGIPSFTVKNDFSGFIISYTSLKKQDMGYDIGIIRSLELWAEFGAPSDVKPEEVKMVRAEAPFRSNLLYLLSFLQRHHIDYSCCGLWRYLATCNFDTFIRVDRLLRMLYTRYQSFNYLLLGAANPIEVLKEMLSVREVETESKYLYRFLYSFLRKRYSDKFKCDMKAYASLVDTHELVLQVFDRNISLEFPAFQQGFFGFCDDFAEANRIELCSENSRIFLKLFK